MSVFDKELTINGKAVRSPEQQVWKNMKDIEELKDIIKPMYKATTSLNSSSTTILISSTNAPDGTKSGWLIDTGGLLFKITGGDETSLLITYYSDLKGPQGEDGAAVNIDDSIESLTKVWSSKKTSDSIKGLISDNSMGNNDKTYSQAYIGNIINNGIWYSTTQPAGTPATINVVDIVISMRGEAYCENTIQVGDMFIYIDNELKASELYKIDDITSGVATVTKICDIGGGKQLYLHTIMLEGAISGNPVRCHFTIKNDINLPFVKTIDYVEGTNIDLIAWFKSKGFNATGLTDIYEATTYLNDGTLYLGIGVGSDNYFYTIANSTLARMQINGTTVSDKVTLV